jgi:hypothetical protein
MGTVVTGAIVAGVLALAVFVIIKDRKRGKGCGCCESRFSCPAARKPDGSCPQEGK